MLIAIPVSRSQASDLASHKRLPGPLQVFAPNDELRAMFEVDDDEEAERAATMLASVWALARHGERIVVVAERDDFTPGDEAANGGGSVDGVALHQVVSWFADDPRADISQAAEQASGRSLDDAWDAPAVAAFITDHDLMWFAADELAREFASQGISRVHFDDPADADAAAQVIADAGHEVAVVKELFDGEDDDEDAVYIVATPAPASDVVALLQRGPDDPRLEV